MKIRRGQILALLLPTALLLFGTATAQATAHRHLPFEADSVCSPMAVVLREERLAGGRLHDLPPLEDGDILVTPCAHTFGWRHGHAGIVVNAAEGLTVEAVSIGTRSAVSSVRHWRTYPTFTVLRLKDADPVTRRAAGLYAQNHLVDLPYRLTSGLREKEPAEAACCHCAYLVWYAYRQFGYDLDGDGGHLVTVADLASSPYLEAVYQAK